MCIFKVTIKSNECFKEGNSESDHVSIEHPNAHVPHGKFLLNIWDKSRSIIHNITPMPDDGTIEMTKYISEFKPI